MVGRFPPLRNGVLYEGAQHALGHIIPTLLPLRPNLPDFPRAPAAYL